MRIFHHPHDDVIFFVFPAADLALYVNKCCRVVFSARGQAQYHHTGVCLHIVDICGDMRVRLFSPSPLYAPCLTLFLCPFFFAFSLFSDFSARHRQVAEENVVPGPVPGDAPSQLSPAYGGSTTIFSTTFLLLSCSFSSVSTAVFFSSTTVWRWLSATHAWCWWFPSAWSRAVSPTCSTTIPPRTSVFGPSSQQPFVQCPDASVWGKFSRRSVWSNEHEFRPFPRISTTRNDATARRWHDAYSGRCSSF